jgi:hypothetical protein
MRQLGKYAGEKLRKALARMGNWVLDIEKCSDRTQDFALLPERWIVERTFAWFGRCCRLNRDETMQASQAWIIFADIRRILRKITQPLFKSAFSEARSAFQASSSASIMRLSSLSGWGTL